MDSLCYRKLSQVYCTGEELGFILRVAISKEEKL
jgi:hypothetical protein